MLDETDYVPGLKVCNCRKHCDTRPQGPCTGGFFAHTVIAKVKQAKFYSVIADEVTDTANKEELSLSLRFVLDGVVKEVFVDFVEVERITG